jgi:hypothetical protein
MQYSHVQKRRYGIKHKMKEKYKNGRKNVVVVAKRNKD